MCEELGWVNGEKIKDARVFVAAFEHYKPRLKQMLALRMPQGLFPRADPSDVLQETYIDAAKRIEQFPESSGISFYVWIRGLACDRLRKILREHVTYQKRSILRSVRLPDRSSADFVQRLLVTPSQAYEIAELKEMLQLALSKISETDREIILMRNFEELSNTEVAQALGIKQSTATMRHGRALFRLKEALTGDDSEPLSWAKRV